MALLDIDLEFFNFLVNPSYKYIKDKIPYFRETYIEEYGEQYRERITKNFNETNYLFLATSKELETFMKKFVSAITIDAYQQIAAEFHLNINKSLQQKCNHNFIENLLLEHHLSFLEEDENLTIFRTDIRNTLISLTCETKEDVIRYYLFKKLEKLDNILEKFDNIMAILQPKIESLKEIKKEKQKFRENLQKEFLEKHSYLLMEKAKQYIKINNHYDIKQLFLMEEKLSLYVCNWDSNEVFSMGRIGFFKKCIADEVDEVYDFYKKSRENVLEMYGIDVQKEDIDLTKEEDCLKRLHFQFKKDDIWYEGYEALLKLEEEIAEYNQRLTDRFNYILYDDEFIQKNIMGEEFLNRPGNAYIKERIPNMNKKEMQEVGRNLFNGIIDYITPNKDVGAAAISTKNDAANYTIDFVLINILKSIAIDENHLETNLFFNLSHELGHVSKLEKKEIDRISNFDFYIKQDLTWLKELINEYESGIVMDKLNQLGLFELNKVKITNNSIHKMNSFLIDPFMKQYQEYFKFAEIKNSLDPIIDLFGEDLFHQYITMINDYYQDYFETDFSKLKMEKKEQLNQQQLQEVLTEISKRNKGHILTKAKH